VAHGRKGFSTNHHWRLVLVAHALDGILFERWSLAKGQERWAVDD